MTVHPDRQIAKLSDDWTKTRDRDSSSARCVNNRMPFTASDSELGSDEQTPKHTHAVMIKSVGSLQNQHNVP